MYVCTCYLLLTLLFVLLITTITITLHPALDKLFYNNTATNTDNYYSKHL